MMGLRLLVVVFSLVVACVLASGQSFAQQTTYQYTGPTFTSASGIYTTSMSISGSLTVSAPLAPNINILLTPGSHPGLTNFSFTDGVNNITFANTTDYGIHIITDGLGKISSWRVDLQKFNRDNPALPNNTGLVTCTTGKPICGEYAGTGVGGAADFTSLGVATNTTVTGFWTVLSLPASTVMNPNAQDKSNANAALQNALNNGATGLLNSALAQNGPGTGNSNGFNFAPTGLGFSRSRVDANNPMDRDFGAAFAPQGYFAQDGSFSSNKGFRFSTDLHAMARAANDKSAQALGVDDGLEDGDPVPRSRVNPFVTGEYVDFDDDERNADRSGHLWVVNGGLSVRLSEQTTAGLFSRYREGEASSKALNATLDAEYYGGGAFLSTTLAGGLHVAIAGLYEEGDNDITIGGATGSFDSQTTTIEGRIDKRLHRGKHWIEPAVSISYMKTDQDNYTDSSGTFVANKDLTLGRLTYGPTIGTTIQHGNAEVRPFAKVNGVWDFDNEGNFVTSTAGVFTSGEHAINLGGGVEVQYVRGMALKLEGNWFAFDTELEGWSLTGGVGTPLAALGFGQIAPAGFVSLDFTGREDGASAQARLRIPLGQTRKAAE